MALGGAEMCVLSCIFLIVNTFNLHTYQRSSSEEKEHLVFFEPAWTWLLVVCSDWWLRLGGLFFWSDC